MFTQHPHEIENRVVGEMETMVSEIDKTYKKVESKKGMVVDFASGLVNKKHKMRNFFRHAYDRGTHVFFACDIVGNEHWTFLFHSILQASMKKTI